MDLRPKQQSGYFSAPSGGVFVFLLALSARLVYLWESSDHPSFFAPALDSFKYHFMCRAFVRTGELTKEWFTQSLFYPFFLSGVYEVFGPSLVAAKIVQAFVGAGTCWLVHGLARRLFDRRVALVAGLAAVFYGPLMFYDGELLGTGWAAFWAVALVSLFLWAASAERRVVACALVGLCGALSVLSRPSFLLVLGVGGCWLLVRFMKDRSPRFRSLGTLVVMVVAFGAATLPVALMTRGVTGDLTFLPLYGGLNFYIGNNPRSDEMQLIRPGPQWLMLKDKPARADVTDPKARQAWFYRQSLRWAREAPAAFARGLGWKALQTFSSREIPNSVSMYVARKWSWTLRLLVWRLWGFGFPFGVLLPLAVVGAARYWRRVPAVVPLSILAYLSTLVAIHACARYRAPIVPVMIPLGAAGGFAIYEMARGRRWRRLAAAVAAIVVLVLLISAPGPFARETIRYEPEIHYFAGLSDKEAGRREEAIADWTKAVELKPDYAMALFNRGATLFEIGRRKEGLEQMARALAIEPDYGEGHAQYGAALEIVGRTDRALEEYRRATELPPRLAIERFQYGRLLEERGRVRKAVEEYEKALELARDEEAALLIPEINRRLENLREAR